MSDTFDMAYMVEVELWDDWFLVGMFKKLEDAREAQRTRCLPTLSICKYWEERSGEEQWMSNLKYACAHNDLVITTVKLQ